MEISHPEQAFSQSSTTFAAILSLLHGGIGKAGFRFQVSGFRF
jgi:hypothetical protein